jgi:hypothetical protein
MNPFNPRVLTGYIRKREFTVMNSKLYTQAHNLALFTIIYNLVEGGVSVWMGTADETLALFGFGVDSFIEVISAIGVWHTQWLSVCRSTVTPPG